MPSWSTWWRAHWNRWHNRSITGRSVLSLGLRIPQDSREPSHPFWPGVDAGSRFSESEAPSSIRNEKKSTKSEDPKNASLLPIWPDSEPLSAGKPFLDFGTQEKLSASRTLAFEWSTFHGIFPRIILGCTNSGELQLIQQLKSCNVDTLLACILSSRSVPDSTASAIACASFAM